MAKDLQELQNSSTMSTASPAIHSPGVSPKSCQETTLCTGLGIVNEMTSGDATAVVSLFQYWITDNPAHAERMENRPTYNITFLVEPTNNTALDFPRCSGF